MRSRSFLRRAAFAVAFLLVSPLLLQGASAQTIWTRPYTPNQVALEVQLPSYEDEDVSLLSGATYLTGTYSLTNNLEVVVELAGARYVTDSTGISQTAFSNPYIGLGFSGETLPVLFEVGARLPFAPDNRAATQAGTLTDFGRTDAFTPEAASGMIHGNTRFQLGRRSTLRIRTGLTYTEFPVERADGSMRDEEDVRWNYQAQVWREGRNLILGATIAGRSVLTTPGTVWTNLRHHLGFSVIADYRYVQPGLMLGISLDEKVRDVAGLYVGLTLSRSYLR